MDGAEPEYNIRLEWKGRKEGRGPKAREERARAGYGGECGWPRPDVAEIGFMYGWGVMPGGE